MRWLFEQYPTLIGTLLGLTLIFWPPPVRPEEEAIRQRRLAELEAGNPERYFEERRALKTYGPNRGGPYRLWGVLLLAVSVSLLFF